MLGGYHSLLIAIEPDQTSHTPQHHTISYTTVSHPKSYIVQGHGLPGTTTPLRASDWLFS